MKRRQTAKAAKTFAARRLYQVNMARMISYLAQVISDNSQDFRTTLRILIDEVINGTTVSRKHKRHRSISLLNAVGQHTVTESSTCN